MRIARTSRTALVAGALVVALTLVLAGAAGAGTLKRYYGFVTFDHDHPGYGACSDNSSFNPRACTGWASWDRSQIDKRTLGKVYLMFWGRLDGVEGWYSNGTTGGTGIKYVTRKGMNNYWESITGHRPIPAYNRVACDHAAGPYNTYAQCQAWRG